MSNSNMSGTGPGINSGTGNKMNSFVASGSDAFSGSRMGIPNHNSFQQNYRQNGNQPFTNLNAMMGMDSPNQPKSSGGGSLQGSNQENAGRKNSRKAM
mmetsp:Transcript_32550/g.49796  ORF Transcript_32550/g.49796 Transcript_32550/m.49796 type:complete len:98 (-) Transcript_32550:212-505(-)